VASLDRPGAFTSLDFALDRLADKGGPFLTLGKDGSRDPEAHCCKNVTPLNGVRGLASAPERNRRFRIQSVERVSK